MSDKEIIQWFKIRLGNLTGYNFAERDEAYKKAIQALENMQAMQEMRKDLKMSEMIKIKGNVIEHILSPGNNVGAIELSLDSLKQQHPELFPKMMSEEEILKLIQFTRECEVPTVKLNTPTQQYSPQDLLDIWNHKKMPHEIEKITQQKITWYDGSLDERKSVYPKVFGKNPTIINPAHYNGSCDKCNLPIKPIKPEKIKELDIKGKLFKEDNIIVKKINELVRAINQLQERRVE